MTTKRLETKIKIRRTELLPADLIFSRSKSALGWAIRWFERALGEEASYTNHTAGIGLNRNVVEALLKVGSTPFTEWAENENAFQVWRTSDLADYRRAQVAEYVEKQIGRKYGAMKLIPHALDGLLSKVIGRSPYVFRRMLFLKRYPICSWMWTFAYDDAGLNFGGRPNMLTPDDMHDFCASHPEKWEMVYEKVDSV